MAKIFLTKVWGFSPETYPALGFNSEAGRIKLLREFSPGDWIIMAGTRTEPTPPEMQGRLLGKVRLGPEEIDVLNVLRSIDTEIPKEHFNENGEYRWPFGLPMLEAYRFRGYPDLREVLGSYLPGQEWAAYAIEIGNRLGADAIRAIDALELEEAEIVEAEVIVRQRARSNALRANQPHNQTGPGPSTERKGYEREVTAASAYIMQLQTPQKKYSSGTNEYYKVGYSANPEERLASLNKGFMPTITGYSWTIKLIQPFPDAQQAFNFEQLVHKRLKSHLVEGEREVYAIRYNTLQSAWIDEFQKADWSVGERVTLIAVESESE